MVLPEPSWRVKTRPCPFYQQGQCLFADSCNFLHAVSVAAIPETVSSNFSTSQIEASPNRPHKPPQVIVDSPTTSIRSPPRSPRTTSLLLALRDVIGDPDDDELSDPSNQAGASGSQTDPWSDALPTLVNVEGFGHYAQQEDSTSSEDMDELDDPDDFEGNWTAISDYSDEDSTSHIPLQDENVQVVQHNQPDEGVSEEEEEEEIIQASDVPASDSKDLPSPKTAASPSRQNRDSVTSDLASGLLSPIELSTLHLGPFRQNSQELNSFDSGFAEHWKPPVPLLASPPRSPSISSTFELLSSPFGSHSARLRSPRLGVFTGMPRSPLSPARTVSADAREEIEPLDLSLDSPQDYHATQAANLTRDDFAEDITASWNNGVREGDDDNEESADSFSDDEDVFEEPSYGHTSVWDTEAGQTAVFVGQDPELVREQVNDAIKRFSRSPTNFLSSEDPDFYNEDAIEHSSLREESGLFPGSNTVEDTAIGDVLSSSSPTSQEPPPDPEDETAFLAYLRSPLVQAPENDTLNSLYDIYSGIAPPREIVSDSARNVGLSPPQAAPALLSNVSTPTSSLRERVFTPPPSNRDHSGGVTAESPTSLSSPITSLDSLSMGRASPFSPPIDKPSGEGSGSQNSGQDIEISRKIAFGFRTSVALGRASRSSLMITRNAGITVPSSPLESQIDITGTDVPSSDATASHTTSISAPPKGLKPLRLSTIVNGNSISRSMFQSRLSTTSVNSFRQSRNFNRSSISSASVLSTNLLPNNHLLSSARSSLTPLQIHDTLSTSEHGSPSSSSLNFFNNHAPYDEPQSAPPTSWRNSTSSFRPSSRLSEPTYERDEEEEDDTTGSFRRDPNDETICRPILLTPQPHTAPVTRAPSVIHQPTYVTEPPRPTLMFAIASDDVEQVRHVLESGEARPNDCVGPQSALAFTLTNDKLSNKLDIVKTLLAYGADPTVAKNTELSETSREAEANGVSQEVNPKARSLMDEMDAATRYYVERADAIHTRRTSALIHRSFFRPLTRVRYELIGQDRALEQLFRVLSMHSRQLSVSPVVVMLCGPSGHGKSLLARKFGALLDVPTHTVNMTTLRSTHDLWQSYSMSPYETPTTCTLAEFLINNEGKRCVVVLDEIEKTLDEKTLWSLLMPWELGRCAFEANSRHVDVRNVIWLGTSNIGHDLVFQHRDTRKDPEGLMSREEYVQLMGLLRPKVSERLGASVLSRITTVLPFVPFTLEEKKAICSEAFYSLGGDASRSLSPATVDAVIDTALVDYCAVEGARSLYRAISNQLVDII